MHKHYEVTDAGYELLEKSGLDKRIDGKWKDVHGLMLRGAFVDKWEIDEILKDSNAPAQRKNTVKNWCKEHDEYDRDSDDFLMVSGEITNVVLSAEEQADYRKFGFESLADMDGLLASYSISKNSDMRFGCSDHSYVWRSNGFKTRIYGDTDGDLQLHQIATKSEPDRITIDGSSPLKLFGELKEGHVNADYSFWPTLVAVALKFADTVGKEIPEAKNWEDFLRTFGWKGEIMKPDSLGYIGFSFPIDYSGNMIARMPDGTDVQKTKKIFMGHMCPNACQDVSYYPVIDESENLVFCRNSNDGTITLAPAGTPEKFAPEICIPKADACELFRGAVQGIMAGQSRTSPQSLAFMLWEYEKLKEGKTPEQVRRESCQFREF